VKLKLNKSLKQQVKTRPVSAKAVMVVSGKILVLRQENGNWDLPGGKVDENESVVEGLIREVWEETKLSVTPIGLLASSTKPRSNEPDLLVLSYLCEVKTDEGDVVVELSHEHVGYKLIDLDDAFDLPMHAHFAEALHEARKHIRKLISAAA